MAPKKKQRLKLMVIPEPEPNTRMVFVFEGPAGQPVMKGDPPGNVLMECGNCGAALVDGVGMEQLNNLVIKCPNCGRFNETLA